MLHIRFRRVLRHSVSRHIDAWRRVARSTRVSRNAAPRVLRRSLALDAQSASAAAKNALLGRPIVLSPASRVPSQLGMFSVPLQRSVALPDVRQKPWPQLQGARIIKQTNSNETECTSEKACRAVRVLFAGEAEAVVAICRVHAFRGKMKWRAQNLQVKILAGLWASFCRRSRSCGRSCRQLPRRRRPSALHIVGGRAAAHLPAQQVGFSDPEITEVHGSPAGLDR